MTPRAYYDDNYGHYNNHDDSDDDADETRSFYNEVQADSVWKNCERCGRKVKLRRSYGTCNSCMEILERGGDPG